MQTNKTLTFFIRISTCVVIILLSNNILAQDFDQIQKILASDGASGDRFGTSVSISGDLAIVGSWLDDDKGIASGSAYIYSKDEGGKDNWGQVVKLTASDGVAKDFFGIGVSISGDKAIVGARGDDEKGIESGSAYIYSKDEGGKDNWGLVSKLIPSDGDAYDGFGTNVSISGDKAIVGVSRDDENGVFSGSVYIYRMDEGGMNNWGEVSKLIPSDGAEGDEFGGSVSISGDKVIVGAYRDDDNGISSGSAYIYKMDEGGRDNWGLISKLTPLDAGAYDRFGSSVSISGDKAIVGAQTDDEDGISSGTAYIYGKNEGGLDNWGEVSKLIPTDGAERDEFGGSVSISGDKAIVGAYKDDDNGNSSGSAYVYSKDEGGVDNWGLVSKLTPTDGAEGDEFGWSVSISGYNTIIGAWLDNDNSIHSGSAYIYNNPTPTGTVEPIPTFGEWGLIFLALSMMIIGVICVRIINVSFRRA